MSSEGDSCQGKRRKIPRQFENSDPVTGDCWKLFRAFGRGGGYLTSPLKDGDRFILMRK